MVGRRKGEGKEEEKEKQRKGRKDRQQDRLSSLPLHYLLSLELLLCSNLKSGLELPSLLRMGSYDDAIINLSLTVPFLLWF